MIETEAQRRWFFATHPEYSWSRTGRDGQEHDDDDSERMSPEEVDAWADEQLQYERDPFQIVLLTESKRWFGTAGQTPETYAELGLPWPDDVAAGHGDKEQEDEEREPTVWESILQGASQVLDGWSPLDISFALAGTSRALGRNLEKAGLPRPPGYAAHHIVPEGDGRFFWANKAREYLAKWGIDIDDAANGVWLPHKARVDSAAYHRVIHAGQYYEKVARMLGEAKSKEQAIKILNFIRRSLSDNSF
jgi:hypothetical protein